MIRDIIRDITRDILRDVSGNRAGSTFTPESLADLIQFALNGSTPYYSATKLNNFELLSSLEPYDDYRAPRQGRYWLLDGSDDYGVNDSLSVCLTADFTIALSAKDLTTSGYFISASNSSSLMVWFNNSTTLNLGNATGWATFPINTTAAADYIIQHDTNEAGFNRWKLLVNGVSVSRASTTGSYLQPTNATPFNIGRRTGGSLYIGIKAWGVGFWTGLKTYAQVQDRDSTNLVAFYPCNEESGTVGYDIGPDARHLTLTNITQATFHAADTGITRNRNNPVGYSALRNWVKYSEDLTNAAWTKRNGAAVTTVAVTGPSGQATTNRLTTPGSNTTYEDVLELSSTGEVAADSFVDLRFYLRDNGSAKRILGVGNRLDSSRGGWSINLDLLDPGWNLITSSHPSVSVTNQFRATATGTFGPGFGNLSASTTGHDVYIDEVQATPVGYADGYVKTTATRLVNQYIPKRLSSSLAADGNALTVEGQSPYPITVETPCVTGDGSTVYADLGSALIPATADFSVSFWLYADPSGSLRYPISQLSGTLWGMYLNGLNAALYFSDGATTTISIAANTWYLVVISRVGDLHSLSINGVTQSRTKSGSIATANTWLLARNDNSLYFGGRIADFSITTGGVTTYFPLQDGPGSSNTNRNLAYYKSDGTYGVVSNAIVNGTVANIWANRCPGYVRDHCIEYGGRLGAGGEFILGVPNTSICADGAAKTLLPGYFANPFSRVNFNPFTAAELNGLGLETAYSVGQDRQSVSPANTKFRRVGDDRFITLSQAATGSALNKLNIYVGNTLPVLPSGKVFIIDNDGNYLIDSSGNYIIGDE